MSLYLSLGNHQAALTSSELQSALFQALSKLGKKHRVLVVPPDITRLHSYAGDLTRFVHVYYGDVLKTILPAVGTHRAMSPTQLTQMFGDIPHNLFRAHNWRTDVITLGEVPSEFVHQQSEGKLSYSWPAEVNHLIVEGGFDLVLSLGQVVPHEVIGMANYNKNILVGAGGSLSIGRSHFLGAVYGMERIMGRADNPVRRVLNYAADHFLSHIPIVYILTVIGTDADDKPVVRGLFIGDDNKCFERAADLSVQVNIQILERPIQKAIVYLNDAEFHSTWLGNKAIYRTRMALADGAELIVLAPGVKAFGEDSCIDQLIRRYGYRGTSATLRAVKENPELAENLGAAAHLIHGSSEGRFTVIYCPCGLGREEVEGAGFCYGNLAAMMSQYDPAKLRDGYNTVSGEEIFYVSNPGLGLWSVKERFQQA